MEYLNSVDSKLHINGMNSAQESKDVYFPKCQMITLTCLCLCSSYFSKPNARNNSVLKIFNIIPPFSQICIIINCTNTVTSKHKFEFEDAQNIIHI